MATSCPLVMPGFAFACETTYKMCATINLEATTTLCGAATVAKEGRRRAAAAPKPRSSVALPAAPQPPRSGWSLASSRAPLVLAAVMLCVRQSLAALLQELHHCSVCRGTRGYCRHMPSKMVGAVYMRGLVEACKS